MVEDWLGYGFYMAESPVQVQERTPWLDHLGEKATPFREALVRYLTTPPFWWKEIGLCGLTIGSKSQAAAEVLSIVRTNPEVLACQENNGFVYDVDHLTMGAGLEAARHTHPPILISSQGEIAQREYGGSSRNSAGIMSYRRHILPPHRVGLYETVGTTGIIYDGWMNGVNRGLSWLVEIAAAGGIIIASNSSKEIVEAGLQERELVKTTPSEKLKAVLRANGKKDNRTPEQMKEYYRKTGDRKTREQQERDLGWIMKKMILKGLIPYPGFDLHHLDAFDKYLKTMNEYTPEVLELIEKHYYPFWLRSLYQSDMHPLGFKLEDFVLTDHDFTDGIDLDILGSVLTKAALIPKMIKVANSYPSVREELRNYGITTP